MYSALLRDERKLKTTPLYQYHCRGQLLNSYLEPLRAGVDVCHHIPFGNWLVGFSFLRMSRNECHRQKHLAAEMGTLPTISEIFPRKNPLMKLFS